MQYTTPIFDWQIAVEYSILFEIEGWHKLDTQTKSCINQQLDAYIQGLGADIAWLIPSFNPLNKYKGSIKGFANFLDNQNHTFDDLQRKHEERNKP